MKPAANKDIFKTGRFMICFLLISLMMPNILQAENNIKPNQTAKTNPPENKNKEAIYLLPVQFKSGIAIFEWEVNKLYEDKIKGFHLYLRNVSESKPFSKINEISFSVTRRKFLMKDLTGGKKYQVYAEALSARNYKSEVIDFYTGPKPPAVLNLKAALTKDLHVILRWPQIQFNGNAGVNIYYKADLDEPFEKVASNIMEARFTHKPKPSKYSQYYYITYTNELGEEGQPSNLARIRMKPQIIEEAKENSENKTEDQQKEKTENEKYSDDAERENN